MLSKVVTFSPFISSSCLVQNPTPFYSCIPILLFKDHSFQTIKGLEKEDTQEPGKMGAGIKQLRRFNIWEKYDICETVESGRNWKQYCLQFAGTVQTSPVTGVAQLAS